jgi:hypothetical protein
VLAITARRVSLYRVLFRHPHTARDRTTSESRTVDDPSQRPLTASCTHGQAGATIRLM